MARCALFALCLLLLPVAVVHAQAPALQPDLDAPASSVPATATTTGVELLWPAVTPHEALAEPVLRRGHDMGLISSGIALISAGMIVGVGLASNDLAQGNCHEFSSTSFFETRVQCGSAAFALVPIAGTILVPAVTFHGFADGGLIGIGAIAAAPQIAGLVLLLIGMHGYTEDLGSLGDDLALSFEPIVSSNELGMSWRLTL